MVQHKQRPNKGKLIIICNVGHLQSAIARQFSNLKKGVGRSENPGGYVVVMSPSRAGSSQSSS